ncbi:MAG TPA: glycosyltransferase family 2 protein [Pyrinomonadaceae bacterium]|nr:glycosyltransferase family 2 protein [Pyrinomonadaceae bacterium]
MPTARSANAIRPFVSLIVVNYNGGEKLRRCVNSLVEDSYAARELIVVDNASTDGNEAILGELELRHADLVVIRSAQNLGYAGGVNLGTEIARGEYVAVLNMDVVVQTGWLDPLIDFLQEHPEAGAVNPLTAQADGLHINALGQDLHITGLGFNHRLGESIRSAGVEPLDVPGIQGAAFVIRRALLEKIGGMDATGFLYHEDVNLSWLLNLMGSRIYCVPQSIVRHDYFLSMYPAKLHLLERNRCAMLLAYLRRPTLLCLLPLLFVTEALMWAYCLLRGWSFLQAKAASYRWVCRHRRQIAERRRLAESLRVLSDWQFLRRLRWAYPLDQLVTLGRERGDSKRQPEGGIPKAAEY